jgi:hypothetical protein
MRKTVASLFMFLSIGSSAFLFCVGVLACAVSGGLAALLIGLAACSGLASVMFGLLESSRQQEWLLEDVRDRLDALLARQPHHR